MRKTILLIAVIMAITPSWAQISLQAYRDSVYRASTELLNAAEEIAKAESLVQKEKTGFLPSLSADASFTTGFRRDGDNRLWGFSLTPQLSQKIYAGGGVRAALSQARSSREVAIYDELYERLTMRYEADYAYWQVSATQLYLAATESYVEIIKSLYRVVQERYVEGYVAKGDLLQVEARLSDAEFAQMTTQNHYEKALHQFNNLCGRHEPSDVELSQSIIDSIPMPRRCLYTEIIERRPDVLAAMWATRAAEHGVKSVAASYNPNVYVGVNGSWQTYSPNNSGRTYLDGSMMLGVNIPIFHWGERKHAVAEAKADMRIKRNLWEQIRDDVEQEEADGWSALTSSYQQMQSSLRNLDIAGENLSISTYAYQEGQATVLDVLQAQISWIQIYTNAITARFNYAVAVSAYMRLTAAD